MSYTNRHYPDRPYRTFGPEELQKFYTLARADLEAENAKLRWALEIIAGKRLCLDGLMGNVDVASAALGETK